MATQDDFTRLAERVSGETTAVSAKQGTYLRWAGAGGAELWLQLNSSGDLIGMNPHFSGESCVRVGLVSWITRSDHTKLDGALHGWAAPPADKPDEGEYPFVFDLPDAGTCSDLEIPGIAEAQIAAFAHEVTFFASEQAYESQQTDGVGFASRSFIPSGLFRPSGETVEPPAAHAIFTGHVLRANTYTNPISREQFYWALIDTLGGTLDVVIDPVQLDREPATGGILSGSFWLSGRVTTHPKNKRGWFRQLFN